MSPIATIGDCMQLSTAVLRDYRRLAVRQQHYPGMIKAPGHVVEGVVYGNISDAGLARLDRFEGEMYARRRVEVELTDGSRQAVYSYVIKPAFEHQLEYRDWHFDEFLRRGKQAFTANYLGYQRIPDEG